MLTELVLPVLLAYIFTALIIMPFALAGGLYAITKSVSARIARRYRPTHLTRQPA